MSSTRYSASTITDPDHPDFPHREERGYQRGCRRECCRRAHFVRQKQERMGIRQMVPAEKVRPHLQRLVKAAGSQIAVARHLDIAPGTVRQIAHGRVESVHHRLATRIAALSPTAVTPEEGVTLSGNQLQVVNKQRSVDLLRRLQADGHPMKELGAELTNHAQAPGWVTNYQTHITVEAARAVEALYARLVDVRGTSTRTARQAAALGYYPGRYYDENDQVDLRAIPEHPWSVLDDRCTRALLVAQALVADPAANRREIAEKVGIIERRVQRVVSMMGVRSTFTKEETAALRAQYEPTLNAWQYDGLDTVVAAMRLGLMPNIWIAHQPDWPTTAEHPGLLEWLAEVSPDQREATMAGSKPIRPSRAAARAAAAHRAEQEATLESAPASAATVQQAAA